VCVCVFCLRVERTDDQRNNSRRPAHFHPPARLLCRRLLPHQSFRVVPLCWTREYDHTCVCVVCVCAKRCMQNMRGKGAERFCVRYRAYTTQMRLCGQHFTLTVGPGDPSVCVCVGREVVFVWDGREVVCVCVCVCSP